MVGKAIVTGGYDVHSAGNEIEMEDLREACSKAAKDSYESCVEKAKQIQQSCNKRADAAIVIISNETTMALKFDTFMAKAGELHESSAHPQQILPGQNGAFVFVSKSKTSPTGLGQTINYAIMVFNDDKKAWVYANQSVSIVFTIPEGKSGQKNENTIKHGTLTDCRYVENTKTRFDGQTIQGHFSVNDTTSLRPIFTAVFTQKDTAFAAGPVTTSSCCVVL
jgi:hypothetical protein